MNIILFSLITLGGIGALSAIVLYVVSKKFPVYENARVNEVENLLPGANCGACGYPSCRAFADACVNAGEMDELFCPVGGTSAMENVAEVLKKKASTAEPTVAVLRCSGACENRPYTSEYEGVKSCAIVHDLYAGETGCMWGCLGKGDCEAVCKFDALHVNPSTLLPEVDEDKCTSCEACVKACPRLLFEIRKKGMRSRRIYVSCMNKDKEAIAGNVCNVACIGCSNCLEVCSFEAITIVDDLAYIDDEKCRLCRKCAPECPTSAILELSFYTKRVS